jgi:CDP-glycerol glycerophosphotransferase (TagB/SpsB family)
MNSKNVHYVYVSGENLRLLEEEFSRGISSKLDEWSYTSAPLKISHGSVNVTFFIYRRAHIMMSHGVADKNYLLRKDAAGGLEINKYRTLCVPGEWLKRRILQAEGVELDENQIKVVGWPRIDSLLAAQREQRKDFKRMVKKANPFRKIKVLWAPTHGQPSKEPLSSYPEFLPYEDRLKEIFDYEASLHPNVRESKTPTFQKLLDADVVIADRGTLVYEAWALGKPVIFPSWIIKQANLKAGIGSAEHHIFSEKLGLHAESFEELVGMIKKARAPDSRVNQFMEEYIPSSTHGKSYELIADAVKEIWDSGDLHIKRKAMPPDSNVEPQPQAL